ncbi:MAG TPA: hypothetical protein ENN80_11825 [Candidatus Hydrogenedentes bacterium]|nr:hypothetical protein [Candidatus Hydrogenedentota bacterium]
MPVEPFAKTPMFALEAAPGLTHRELRTYLACLRLAGFTAPRQVRAAVGTIADAAHIDRAHANRALIALSGSSDDRPALISYRPGKNQYAPAVVTILESGCVVSAHPQSAACAVSAHPKAHPKAHPRHLPSAETAPLEPESQREEQLAAGLFSEIAELLSRRSSRTIPPEHVERAVTSSASDLLPSEIRRAAEGVARAGVVRSPLALFRLKLGDERASRVAF